MKYKKLIIVFFILLVSCKEDVLFVGEYQQKYALFAILKGDSDFQIATVTKSFPVENLHDVKEEETFVDSARVRLWLGDDVFIMKDSSVAGENNLQKTFYYAKNVKLEAQRSAEIEAILPNGKKLRATTKVPKQITFDGINNARNLPPLLEDHLYFGWTSEETDLIYSPRLVLTYFKKDNSGKLQKFERQLPMQLTDDSEERQIFPRPDFTSEIKFNMNAINKAMREISAGDPDKSSYLIYKVELELVVFDRNLSAYYAASHFSDEFSIRLDEIDFSNVEGGLGIFGSYMLYNWPVTINVNYIKSFGYRKY